MKTQHWNNPGFNLLVITTGCKFILIMPSFSILIIPIFILWLLHPLLQTPNLLLLKLISHQTVSLTLAPVVLLVLSISLYLVIKLKLDVGLILSGLWLNSSMSFLVCLVFSFHRLFLVVRCAQYALDLLLTHAQATCAAFCRSHLPRSDNIVFSVL